MIKQRQNQMFITESVKQTETAGRQLACILESGDTAILTGPLGAGKTCFIRGLGVGLGIEPDEIKSPSFTLINEYSGKMPLFHFDLYRMQEITELYHIGWDDYLMRDGIVVVEWGEKAGYLLPDIRIEVKIEILSEKKRQLYVSFLG